MVDGTNRNRSVRVSEARRSDVEGPAGGLRAGSTKLARSATERWLRRG